MAANEMTQSILVLALVVVFGLGFIVKKVQDCENLLERMEGKFDALLLHNGIDPANCTGGKRR